MPNKEIVATNSAASSENVESETIENNNVSNNSTEHSKARKAVQLNDNEISTSEPIDWYNSVEEEIYNESTKTDDPEKAEDLIEENEDSDSEGPAVVKLTDVFSVVHPDLKVPECLKNRYNEDSFFKIISEKPTSYPNFECVDGLMFLKTNGFRVLCIPDIEVKGIKIRMS